MELIMEYHLLKAPTDALGRLQDQLNTLAGEGWTVVSTMIEQLALEDPSSFHPEQGRSALIVLLERPTHRHA